MYGVHVCLPQYSTVSKPEFPCGYVLGHSMKAEFAPKPRTIKPEWQRASFALLVKLSFKNWFLHRIESAFPIPSAFPVSTSGPDRCFASKESRSERPVDPEACGLGTRVASHQCHQSDAGAGSWVELGNQQVNDGPLAPDRSWDSDHSLNKSSGWNLETTLRGLRLFAIIKWP